ncbi:hypothetical protein ACFFLE_11060 [Salinicoccus siamensis]|uniref:Uncharacterized protein n=1 Tax=Salinicoccus siamensis TaxID=381830 RepID=A0ABV5Z7I2_9STAP
MWINKNMTSAILGIIYAVSAYLIMRFGFSDEISLGMYAIVIIGGVIFILILFNYILKYDFFKTNKGE